VSGFLTRAIHEGRFDDRVREVPLSTPVWLTSEYEYVNFDHYTDVISGRRGGFVYGRGGSPTHSSYHRLLASLEGADSVWSFSSGMGALSTIFLSHLRPGGHMVAQRRIYGGTSTLVRNLADRFEMNATFVEAEIDSVAGPIRESTQMVLVETLANPTLEVVDLEAIGQLCRELGVLFVVDNTLATPYLVRPIEWAPDAIVVHSATKYLGGHSDLVGGTVAAARASVDRIREASIELGTTSSAFECWLASRGLQTLGLRLAQQSDSAMKIAEWLTDRDVRLLHYPGLASDSQHERAVRYLGGTHFGAMLSFELCSGVPGALDFADRLRVARVISSFGGLHTGVSLSYVHSHRQLSTDELEAAGITPGLIRVAVGGEDVADLFTDFDQALRGEN
jgi:cystathionine beta-lyase/cystathionine gamma-synthase